MESIVNKLRNLDVYPKINKDFYSRTLSSGVITLLSSLFMLVFLFSELSMNLFLFPFSFFIVKWKLFISIIYY